MTRITKTDKNGEIFFFSMDHAFTKTYKFPIKKKKKHFLRGMTMKKTMVDRKRL